MSNKIGKHSIKKQPSPVRYADHQTSKKILDPSQRIFPPPTFLFEVKEERKIVERKINFSTLNSFKAKLDVRVKREISSMGKRSRTKELHRVVDAKRVKVSKNIIEEGIERMISSELGHLQEEGRRQLSLKHTNSKKREQMQQDTGREADQYDLSPYAKYSTNSFPKKEVKLPFGKNRVVFGGRNQYITGLGFKVRASLGQQLQQLDNQLTQIASQNILEVMTIFSIKDHIKQFSSIKDSSSKKRELFHSLAADRKHQLKYKKKRYFYAQNDLESELNLEKVYSKKLYSYMHFISRVRYSNNLQTGSVVLNDKYGGEKVKVYVGKGNNKNLIIALLRRRFWLEITNKITTETKFIWTQNSIQDVHDIQKKARSLLKIEPPKIEFIAKGSDQQNTPNLQLRQNNQQILENRTILNPSFLQTCTSAVGYSPTKTSLRIDQRRQHFIKQQDKKLFLNASTAERVQKMLKTFKIITRPKNGQYSTDYIDTMTNHIPHNSFIGSKKALFYTMEHYYRVVKKIDPFTILPKTYHFKNNDDESFNLFLQNQKQGKDQAIWIVKPGECSNRGTGIYLARTGDISRKLLKKQSHQNGQPKTTIVQSYICQPLLFQGRKFDIRHFMLVTVVNGNLKAYWYSQGYLRTSSQHFSLDSLSNLYIHLTNDAIQQTSQHYGKYEPGNKLSYSELQRYLDNAHTKKKISLKEMILPKMKEIATDIVRANYLNLDRERRINNFQIFGLDFMIDKEFQPWLIQVNANPCLEISCPLMSRIVPIMVEHSLRLALDPLLLPPSHYPPNHRYYLSGNFAQNLRYEIIFDELEQNTISSNLGLSIDFVEFDEPQDEYENEGTDLDLATIID